MKKTTIGIILRILSIVSLALYVYHFFKTAEFNSLIDNGEIALAEYNSLMRSIQMYLYPLPIFFVIDGFFNLNNKKKRLDRKISLKAYLLPEFNYADEREAVLTGQAAKVGLAAIIAYTVILFIAYIFIQQSIDVIHPLAMLLIVATASIPIIGLSAYLISYRYYYAK